MSSEKQQKGSRPSREPRAIATIPAIGAGREKPKLPPAPEVDEEALSAVEQALGTTDPLKREAVVVSQTTRRNRRKKEQPITESMLVKGPKPVIDAFNKYKDDEGYRSSWAALEQLLLNSGVSLPEFDV